ncbi:TIGR03086 family protein [Nocardia puris]|uniref:TIGR03086 family metal-binding protein n=1 Tax=Nocardia puris TaxID=208602 RepID=UPI001892F830|nr:TIGR03086 family metal-binding protein [Nocardia puris]MBF6211417.1 TIGR03086 family protein [Nocardia puris]
MQPFDLDTAADELAVVVAGIRDDQLDAATPCAGMTVGDLLDHVVGLTEAFRQAATKESVGNSASPPPGGRENLAPDWRTRIPAQLKALVAAWRETDAWEGDTEAGGVQADAGVMAMIALDELVIHGWDLARATGQDFTCADPDTTILFEFLRETPPEGTPGLFGPSVPIPSDAPLFDRVLGFTGREPSWPN